MIARLVLLLIFAAWLPAGAQGQMITDSFTYQGRLTQAGSSAEGDYDFEFRLFDAAFDGTRIGEIVALNSVPVRDGVFSVELDFGPSLFDGNRRWLEIRVRESSASGFTVLAPLQEIQANPYSLHAISSEIANSALTADSAISAASATIATTAETANAVEYSNIQNRPAGLDDGDDDSLAGVAGCADGEVLRRAGGAWQCAQLDDTSLSLPLALSESIAGYVLSVANTGYGGGGLRVSSDDVALASSTTSSFAYAGVFQNTGASNGPALFASGSGLNGIDLALGGDRGKIIANGSATADFFLQGNDDILIDLDEDNNSSADTSFRVRDGDNTTAFSVDESGNGVFSGSLSAASQLALGGSPAVIAANGSSSADLDLRSNGDVRIDLDVDGTASGNFFGIRNSDNDYLFYIYETAAGYFTDDLTVSGTLSKGGGTFQIDHPLDPENKILRHSFVESPDMMNVYNGNVVLDQNGEAWVDMPDYFEALNRDFRYQLTAIGAASPYIHVAEEIAGNRFRISGGNPGVKVSWQVTGVRQDAWAETNRVVVEEDKPETQRGKLLHPTAFGEPETKAIHLPTPEKR